MKTIQTLLISAALLPLPGCAEPAANPATFPAHGVRQQPSTTQGQPQVGSCLNAVPVIPSPVPGAPKDTQARYYVPTSKTQATHLNQVLTKAARLELSHKRWDCEAVTRVVEGDELRAYLLQFERVQQWYEQRYRPNFRFHPSRRTTAVFFDAGGNKLTTLQSAMTHRDVTLCYTTKNGKSACLIHVLGEYLPGDSESRTNTNDATPGG